MGRHLVDEGRCRVFEGNIYGERGKKKEKQIGRSGKLLLRLPTPNRSETYSTITAILYLTSNNLFQHELLRTYTDLEFSI